MVFEKAHVQLEVLQNVLVFRLRVEVKTRTPHGDAAERGRAEYARGRSQEAHHLNSKRYERCPSGRIAFFALSST
jgi:hypothetical protein